MVESRLEAGQFHFTVDSRLLRELGERLVRRPETALIELVKNSYDADATTCTVERSSDQLIVRDDGRGMTMEIFRDAWMRLGTDSKAASEESEVYRRKVTGEKGIGRFSVRFLGTYLRVQTVAHDQSRRCKTRLTATFDWPVYDTSEDLGVLGVPFELSAVSSDVPTGTCLTIGRLRETTQAINEKHVLTALLGLVSPLRALLPAKPVEKQDDDPGFSLSFSDEEDGEDGEEQDVAASVLAAYFLQARLKVANRRLSLQVFERGVPSPEFSITDTVTGLCGDLQADIRFFPRRAGLMKGLQVDGRTAYAWIKENSGVAVFDRNFRVSPYGESGDDWLGLREDAARNARRPRSPLARKHFPMTDAEQKSTAENWMLRLPDAAQLVGAVQVIAGRSDGEGGTNRLTAAADREGFVADAAFGEMTDHIRGAVEAIAMVDRRLQRRREEAQRAERLRSLQEQAARAARDVQRSNSIPAGEKQRIVRAITSIASDATEHENSTRTRVRQLETLSLLGVVAGFMTHEFGVALSELEEAKRAVETAASTMHAAGPDFSRYEVARKRLGEFIDYSTAYIRGSRLVPDNQYPALPRVKHVIKTFAAYARERSIDVSVDIPRDVLAPRIPTSLYDGIVLNLFTNALKAVTAQLDLASVRRIDFKAWNDGAAHWLQVTDSGIGVPEVLRERVFDPLFTTTDSQNDPLGSGMGLGLALVRSSAEAFGGRVQLVDPPSGTATCVQVRFPSA